MNTFSEVRKRQTATLFVLSGALLGIGSTASADIIAAGVNVGTTYAIAPGDVIDYGFAGVQVDAPGDLLTMTGGDVSANGGTGFGVFVLDGNFTVTGGLMGGGNSTGSGLRVNGGTATIGGTAEFRGGTNTGSTGSGMSVAGGSVTVNGGDFFGGGITGGAFSIGGGQVEINGGTFHAAWNNPGFGISVISGGVTDFNGGTVLYDVRFAGDAEVNIFNGQFDDQVQIMDDSTTTIFGSSFLVDGVPVPATSLPLSVTDNDPVIDVVYFDSSTETIAFNRLGTTDATLILTNVNPIPEPTAAALAMFGLTLAAGGWRRSQ